MKNVKYNQKTNLPNVEFEDSDSSNANEVRQFIKGEYVCRKCGNKNQLNVWKILTGYFASVRIAIEEMGKLHARSRAKKDLCSNDFSILDGFDLAVGFPKKMVDAADKLDKLAEEAKNASNGSVPDDGYGEP